MAGPDDDAIAIFARDATNESLTYVGMVQEGTSGVFGLVGVSGVSVSSDGRHVVSVAQTDDALTLFARDATSDALAFADILMNDVDGVFGLDGPRGVAAQAGFVYVASTESAALSVFARDATQDAVVFLGAFVNGDAGVAGLVGAGAVAASADGLDVFVAAEVDDAITVFRRNLPGGPLEYVESFFNGIQGIEGLDGAAAVAVSPDGHQVFVASRFDDALAVFDRRFDDGPALAPRAVFRNGEGNVLGLAGAASVELNPLGTMVFVGSGNGDGVAVFSRDPGTGVVAFREQVLVPSEAPNLSSLVSSPDGLQLYATSWTDALVTFRIDSSIFRDGFESNDTSAWSFTAPIRW